MLNKPFERTSEAAGRRFDAWRAALIDSMIESPRRWVRRADAMVAVGVLMVLFGAAGTLVAAGSSVWALGYLGWTVVIVGAVLGLAARTVHWMENS